MDYLQLLENSYKQTAYFLDHPMSRLAYVGGHIFDFTTYDDEIDELFAQKLIGVCKAISDKETFQYQETEEDYRWYLIMCNMPFLQNKLEWGTSIRGAWWDLHGEKKFELSSCGLFEGEEQILEPLEFNETQWVEFIKALDTFTSET